MTEKSTELKAHASGRLGLVGLIFACFALLIALGTLFLTIENRLEQNQLQLLPATLPQLAKSSAEESTQALLKTVDSRLEAQQQAIDSLQQAFKQSSAPMDQTQAKILINLAQMNHQAGSQEPITIALLQLAKQKLHDSQNSMLIHDINQDINNLEKNKGKTISQLLNQLEQAKKLTTELQGLTTQSPVFKANSSFEHWYERWWRNFQTLFVVQRIDNNSKGLLSTDQVSLVKASLELQLDMASWGLMQGNSLLFQQSLARANQLANEGFNPSDALKALKSLLQALAATELNQPHNLLSYQLMSH